MSENWRLGELLEFRQEPTADALFVVEKRQRGGRWRAGSPRGASDATGWWAIIRPEAPIGIGDAPDRANPLYLMAIVASKPSVGTLPDIQMPQIVFHTDEHTRRSMTLNGMRMSTEYFATGSLRVLELIENRLEAGQTDIVHNVLVYLMQSVLDVQAEEREDRNLRAEALAAFLGLNQQAMELVLSSPRPAVHRVVQRIEAGEAGIVRRKIAIDAVVENQLEILRPQLRDYTRQQENILQLVDQVVARLRNT